MKKLNPPKYDDDLIVTDLSTNKRLKYANPALQDNLQTVLNNYADYIRNNGNPWVVDEDGGLPGDLNDALKGLYETKPGGLSILRELRKSTTPITCPMCGGFGNGTLDHYLPKENYPQYSIFTKNLVPVCNCNSLKGLLVKGANNSERVLHPYFDDCLLERILSVSYDGDFNYPTLSIINCCPAVVVDYNAIKFHFDEIILKTNIEEWLISKWADILRVPLSILDTLPKRVVTSDEVRKTIKDKMLAKDEEFSTPNNWDSVFFHGLLNSNGLITWLTNYINRGVF